MPPQPNRSQSFNNFAQPQLQQQQPQQPQWRPVWNQQPPSQQNQQIKPDLSAFDSLLSTSSSSNSKIPMNSLMGECQQFKYVGIFITTTSEFTKFTKTTKS